jgi:hypothetical protein
MAPLGIITAIVGAIRVGGPPWLRAIIGRARENRAAPEVELMSSTSHEVCELWNGEAVVRMVGRPEIQQLVFLDGCEDEEELGIYSVAAAEKQGYLVRKRMMKLPHHNLDLTDLMRISACNDPLTSQFGPFSRSIAATLATVKGMSVVFLVGDQAEHVAQCLLRHCIVGYVQNGTTLNMTAKTKKVNRRTHYRWALPIPLHILRLRPILRLRNLFTKKPPISHSTFTVAVKSKISMS